MDSLFCIKTLTQNDMPFCRSEASTIAAAPPGWPVMAAVVEPNPSAVSRLYDFLVCQAGFIY